MIIISVIQFLNCRLCSLQMLLWCFPYFSLNLHGTKTSSASKCIAFCSFLLMSVTDQSTHHNNVCSPTQPVKAIQYWVFKAAPCPSYQCFPIHSFIWVSPAQINDHSRRFHSWRCPFTLTSLLPVVGSHVQKPASKLLPLNKLCTLSNADTWWYWGLRNAKWTKCQYCSVNKNTHDMIICARWLTS